MKHALSKVFQSRFLWSWFKPRVIFSLSKSKGKKNFELKQTRKNGIFCLSKKNENVQICWKILRFDLKKKGVSQHRVSQILLIFSWKKICFNFSRTKLFKKKKMKAITKSKAWVGVKKICKSLGNDLGISILNATRKWQKKEKVTLALFTLDFHDHTEVEAE